MVMQVLQEVIEGHPILLSRARRPCRLGVSLRAQLVDGAPSAAPLVCPLSTPTDGDQMAVHCPWRSRRKRRPAC